MNKISFDFDATLSRESVQKIVKKFIEQGFEVHVVTARFEDTFRYENIEWRNINNKDLFRVTDHLGISRKNIHFMNLSPKYKFFQENEGFLFHFDDDVTEIEEINQNTSVTGIICTPSSDDWKNLLESYLTK